MADSDREAIRRRHLDAHERALEGLTVAPWIGGESVETGEVASTSDPVIDEPIVDVPVCDEGTVDRAVGAAWDAFEGSWGETTPVERSRRLFEWIDALQGEIDELALLESLDTGKPISHARGEVEGAIETLEYYASVIRAQTGEQVPAGDDLHMFTRTEPYGVVGQVVVRRPVSNQARCFPDEQRVIC